LKKGKKMAGHMGDERVTARSLDVVRIDAAQNLLLVKGPIPGANVLDGRDSPRDSPLPSKAKKWRPRPGEPKFEINNADPAARIG
jgi:hypothetical protein